VTTLEGGRVPTNGLLLETASGSVLIDAGWSVKQAEALLQFAEVRLHRPVVRAIITHSHQDRSGGVAALQKRKLPVLMHTETARLLGVTGTSIETLRSERVLRIGSERLEVFFPGHGHAPDNLVVWLPRQRLLYGGCAIKGGDATDLGNTADAHLKHWASAVSSLQARYASARFVIPGHGTRGDLGLLGHTLALIDAGGRDAEQ